MGSHLVLKFIHIAVRKTKIRVFYSKKWSTRAERIHQPSTACSQGRGEKSPILPVFCKGPLQSIRPFWACAHFNHPPPLHSLGLLPPPLCAQLILSTLPQLGQQRLTHPSTPLVHNGLGFGLWPRCGHLETTQAVRLKSGSSMSIQQFIKFSDCGENCIWKFNVFQCGPGRRMQACCTGLPSRMPIKVNRGEPALQPAASDGQRHNPCEHNLNYTIWTLFAESVRFPINAPLLKGAHSEINHSTASSQFNQLFNPACALQSIIQPRPYSCQRTMCPGLRVNRRIDQSTSHWSEPSCQRTMCPELRVNRRIDQSISHWSEPYCQRTMCPELRVNRAWIKEDTHTSVAPVLACLTWNSQYCWGCVVVDRTTQHKFQMPNILLQTTSPRHMPLPEETRSEHQTFFPYWTFSENHCQTVWIIFAPPPWTIHPLPAHIQTVWI